MADATFKMNDRELDPILNAPKKAREDILQSWGSYMLRRTRENFRNESEPDGTPWPETKYRPETVKSERVNKRTGKVSRVFQDEGSDRRWVRTLYGRGDLFRSVEKFHVDKWAVGVGTNMVYARTHQEGARFTATPRQSLYLFRNVFSRYWGREAMFSWNYLIEIPARPFMGFNDDDYEKLEQICVTKLVKYMRKHGYQRPAA